MVSCADTASRTAATPSVAASVLISGSTRCAANRSSGSSSTTQSLTEMFGSVVKMSAASTWPFFSALIVSGPPASSARNSPKVTP